MTIDHTEDGAMTIASVDWPSGWEYQVVDIGDHIRRSDQLDKLLNGPSLGEIGWLLVLETDEKLVFVRPAPPPPTNVAVAMLFTIKTGASTDMGATLTINSTDGLADVQFVDTDNDKVEGPLDSVTQAPIAPGFASDNPVLTIAAATEDPAQPGHWTAVLGEAGAGVANVSVDPLVNSDGSAVNEPAGTPNAGQPFAVPAPVNVTVNPGAPVGEVFTVTGS